MENMTAMKKQCSGVSVTKMTDNELNIKVAELAGWKKTKGSDLYPKLQFASNVDYWSKNVNGSPGGWSSEVPRFATDLNLMHEAENRMTEGQKYRYGIVLENSTSYTDQPRRIWNATARQRAEAFVNVMSTDIETEFRDKPVDYAFDAEGWEEDGTRLTVLGEYVLCPDGKVRLAQYEDYPQMVMKLKART
jgi:hypothetical protein